MRSAHRLARLWLVTAATVAAFGVIGLADQASTRAGGGVDASGLPKDVNAETRNRLPPITREQVNGRLRKDYDTAAARSATGRPEGVAAIRLHRSGVDVRWDAAVGRRLSELSIIATSRELDQPYEWSLHMIEALSVGLEQSVIDVIRDRKPLTGLADKDAVMIQLAREFGKHHVTAETYARAVTLFGLTDFVDLADLMSGYASTAVNLTAANQFMPPQMKQFLPLPFTPPNDILPDSRSRIPPVNPATPERTGEAVMSSGLYRRTLAPYPTGPGSMGRFAAGLPSLEKSVGRPLIDLAALVTAREYDQQYDWTLTELAARKDGLEPALIDVVRSRKPTTGLGEKEAALVEFGRELHGKHNISADTYARAKKIFGQQDLSDFTVNVMAPHTRDAFLLIVFDQHLPPGQKPLLTP